MVTPLELGEDLTVGYAWSWIRGRAVLVEILSLPRR